MKKIVHNRKITAAFLAALLAFGMMTTGCGGKQEATEPAETVAVTQPQTEEVAVPETTQAPTEPVKLAIDVIEEQGDMMVVETTYCQLKYPFAFGDLIEVECINSGDTEALVFSVKLDLSSYRMFTITFGQTEGILLGTLLTPNAEEPVPVYADLGQIDENLPENFVNTFYAAQESFNDVIGALMENENFTAAE